MKNRKLFALIMIVSLIISACVKDEVFQGPPVINPPVLNPQSPVDGQAVQVSVKVTDLNGVASVKLFYNPGQTAFTEVLMTASGDMYSGTIPGQDSDVTVNYYLVAENESEQKAYYPAGAPTSTASFTVGAPLILMNEIYSRGVIEDPDWVEIYNDSDVEVDISGYMIYDNGGQTGAKPKLAFPEGTKIPGKGFFVIVTDIGGDTGFGLSSGGEEIWLENAGGNIIDNIIFPAMDVTQSYGRNPDGSPNLELLNTITRGSANSTSAPVAVVLMNEIFSQGNTENPDWIELYNASTFEANIGGYKIYDSGGQSGSKPKKEIPAGTVIAAKSWYYIVVDDGTESGFGLSSSGEEVWLENAAGSIIDNAVFPALEAAQSFGRYPDGAATWQVLYVVTPGAANDNSTPPPPGVALMNEVYSRGTTENPDWIEIFNPGTSPMDISGYKIYDSGGQAGTKPKKEFPAGTIIPAGGWAVIVVDDGELSGFGLSSGGEKVWFENIAGAVLDSIEFPALEEGQSYGRYPDGNANWHVLNVVTPGAANDNSTPPPAGIALMNEINSRGTTENPDWIEVYNPSSSPLDLTGFKIYDSGGQAGTKPKKEFPAGTILPAGGWFVIVVDDADPSGFGLSSGGEEVWLENAAGEVIDNIVFPAMEAGQTYGRYPDGNANWQILYFPTPGAANDNSSPPPTLTFLMNEVFSRGTTEDPDWIEVYNTTGNPLDLTGYKIYDAGGNTGTKPKKEFPAGTIVPANGFYVIVVDDADPSGFGLSSGGEEIWLEDPAGTVIDNFAFPAMTETTYSYGRKPDGSSTFFIFTEMTKGGSNNNAGTLPKVRK